MAKSLLFLPDISGFTNFVQTTEIGHSQHVISELLEILITSNKLGLELAEIEGDALFFYREEVPDLHAILDQVEAMFAAFYTHLHLLGKNRICPCNACANAPNLQLKIIAHIGDLQFINVHNKRKPFGTEVIEAHRLMKNSVKSDNYFLMSKTLSDYIHLASGHDNSLFKFSQGSDTYDNIMLEYVYAIINKENLTLKPFPEAIEVSMKRRADFNYKSEFPISAEQLLELITNYSYRHHWAEGVDKIEFQENEVTRLGSEHVCVIGGKHLEFVTVTKQGNPGELIYGELTSSPPPVDELYQFYFISPINTNSCKLRVEVYLEAKSIIKKLVLKLLVKRVLKKSIEKSMNSLLNFTRTSMHLIDS